MNIRHALENAEKFLNEGSIDTAEGLVNTYDDYFKRMDPGGNIETPFICCNTMVGNIIHCGTSEEGPLFPGTWDERIKLCRQCRDWCREKIKELRASAKASSRSCSVLCRGFSLTITSDIIY